MHTFWPPHTLIRICIQERVVIYIYKYIKRNLEVYWFASIHSTWLDIRKAFSTILISVHMAQCF